ncbi:hypothetical protein [Aquimarina atlantica]|uniref:hypothetical protein n=1 Tax=Aquimarina atlantica TaxID=1317122 RepID=UPI000AD8A833|nr:hypothetical protein [Aquimarina atlantica]
MKEKKKSKTKLVLEKMDITKLNNLISIKAGSEPTTGTPTEDTDISCIPPTV